MSATGENLRAIQEALDAHDRICPNQVTEIRMNPFEVERLGFEDFKGIPIVGDPQIGTGRFRLVCGTDHDAPEEPNAYEDVPEVVTARGGGVYVRPLDPREGNEWDRAGDLIEIRCSIDV